MWNFIKSMFFAGVGLVTVAVASAQTTPTDGDSIYQLIGGSSGLLENATLIFNAVVTIVIAVVSLGVLLTFIKKVKKS